MRKIISLLLVFIIVFGFTAAAPKYETSFNDVPKGHYFEEYIYKLKELNIVNGKATALLASIKIFLRAEFLTFLVRLQGQGLISCKPRNVY